MKFAECATLTTHTNDNTIFDKNIQVIGSSPPVLQTKVSKKQFGEYDDETNRQIVKKIPANEKNNNAIPNNGESYAIVRKDESLDNKSPYHIAFVLYTHENINITIEASADATPLYYPRFGFYDTEPNKTNTFHNFWSKQEYNNSETIVLEKRDIDTVLKEIVNEKNNKPDEYIKNNPNSNKRKRSGGVKNRKKTVKKKTKTKIPYKIKNKKRKTSKR